MRQRAVFSEPPPTRRTSAAILVSQISDSRSCFFGRYLLLKACWEDLKAVRRNDPVCKSHLEAFACHTPLHAIWLYRTAHLIQKTFRIRIIPRFIAALARFWSGIEIHPSARIGDGFFIDHGTGVVIGETVDIGANCIVFHNVTLGGTGKHTGKRHPTIGNNVIIGTGAILLGPITVGNNVKIGANSFVMMRDVPANCTVVGTPGRIVKLEGRRMRLELPRTGTYQPETRSGCGEAADKLLNVHT